MRTTVSAIAVIGGDEGGSWFSPSGTDSGVGMVGEFADGWLLLVEQENRDGQAHRGENVGDQVHHPPQQSFFEGLTVEGLRRCYALTK